MDQLVGVWERQLDNFAGSVVRMERTGVRWEGRLIYGTTQTARSGWQVGDLKWIVDQTIKPGKFRGRDLQKTFDSSTGEILRTEYLDRIFAVSKSEMVIMEGGLFWWFQSRQLWRRI